MATINNGEESTCTYRVQFSFNYGEDRFFLRLLILHFIDYEYFIIYGKR